MKLKWVALVIFRVFTFSNANAQNIDHYLSDIRESLGQNGTLTAPTCHSLQIGLTGPWGNFAIPDGTNLQRPGELTWLIMKVDVLRLYINLSDLAEDRIENRPIFSLGYISKHQKGAKYIADTPSVTIFANELNKEMAAHIVDLDKVHALRGRSDITESQMGMTVEARKFAILLFSDQQHADVFQKAIQKAIVLCKAQ